MTEIVRAQGVLLGRFETGLFDQGAASFTSATVVLTVTRDQIVRGTRSVSSPFDQTLDFGSGEAKIYGLNPVRVRPLTGSFSLGESGTASFVHYHAATFSDFAIHRTGSVDPAILGHVVSGNNGTPTAGVGVAWSRHQRVFYPPKRARFMVPHFQVQNVPVAASQYFDAFQTEVLTKDATGPSPYESPRSIRPIVKPTRLNLAPHPRRAETEVVGDQTITLDSLIPGKVYVASVDIRPDSHRQNVWLETTGTTLAGQSLLGITEHDDWYRVWLVFQAWHREEDLRIVVAPDFVGTPFGEGPFGEGSFGGTYYVTPYEYRKVLVEHGNLLRPWFDGDSGEDYLWEQGGIPGEARSYFYEDRIHRHYLLIKTLQENVPIGVSVIDPEYAENRTPFVFLPYGFGPYGYGIYGG